MTSVSSSASRRFPSGSLVLAKPWQNIHASTLIENSKIFVNVQTKIQKAKCCPFQKVRIITPTPTFKCVHTVYSKNLTYWVHIHMLCTFGGRRVTWCITVKFLVHSRDHASSNSCTCKAGMMSAVVSITSCHLAGGSSNWLCSM